VSLEDGSRTMQRCLLLYRKTHPTPCAAAPTAPAAPERRFVPALGTIPPGDAPPPQVLVRTPSGLRDIHECPDDHASINSSVTLSGERVAWLASCDDDDVEQNTTAHKPVPR
jgi:hypothetical protein